MACASKQKPLSDFIQFDDETILWTASLILLNHLQRPDIASTFKGKRVLELGSGLGHLGLGLYRLGAQVTCTERPKELPHLEANLAARKQDGTNVLETALALFGRQKSGTDQGTSSSETTQAAAGSAGTADTSAGNSSCRVGDSQCEGSITAVALEWGEEGYNRSPLSTQSLGTFDLIICSELLYIERLFPELLWTLRRFSGPETLVWSIFIDRPFSFMFFSLMHDEGCWDVDQVEDFDDLGLDEELQVHMHRIRLKQ